ncbi:hypothetical protein D623_10012643 [Myotis brandtii]|uniref:Uncharacterized protein n=1 Tax=Myotis brandtii TaxID=109478 RepID=S7Q626_MYOBR|nr:hypothetical protein D623_10012643 [Myotis brandtii]
MAGNFQGNTWPPDGAERRVPEPRGESRGGTVITGGYFPGRMGVGMGVGVEGLRPPGPLGGAAVERSLAQEGRRHAVPRRSRETIERARRSERPDAVTIETG